MPTKRMRGFGHRRAGKRTLEQWAVRLEAEHRAPHRLVVHELQLVVPGDDLGVARVALERAAVEDGRGAGRRADHVRGLGGALSGVGHGRAEIRALSLRDELARYHR